MILWRDNKKDQEWEASVEQLADWYMESKWPDIDMMIDRKLPIFMGDPDGPVNSVFEPGPEYQQLLVTRREWQRLKDKGW